MYDVFWRTFGNSSYLEKQLEDGRYHGINVTVLEPEPETGIFDPIGMLNAHPGKSRKLLLAGLPRHRAGAARRAPAHRPGRRGRVP